jgi:hypothetical protein
MLLAGALLLTGCLEEKLVPTEPLVVSAPWQAPESLEYKLLDREDGDEVGRGTLEVVEQDGQYELSQSFTNDQEYDNSSVLVDQQTLKPISGMRDYFFDGDEKRLRTEYDASNPDEEVVTIIEIKADGEERPVPHRLKSDWYDNDTSLFLWRSLQFVQGLEVTYHSVVTGSGEQPVVRVEVVGRERITVPAGTFDTWILEIRGQGREQVAWYADTPEHPLVQYDNSVQFFQLLTEPGG